jgi:hypothetical protein
LAYISKRYTILTAGNISGQFGTLLTTNRPANFTDALSYDATHAYLDLTLNFAPPPAPTAPAFGNGLNSNQNNVGDALINYFNTNGTIPIAFGSLTPAGLSQLSGEVGSAPQQTTFNAMNQFMGVMTDPFIAGRGDPISAGGTPNTFADESLAYAAKSAGRSKSERDAYAAVSGM